MIQQQCEYSFVIPAWRRGFVHPKRINKYYLLRNETKQIETNQIITDVMLTNLVVASRVHNNSLCSCSRMLVSVLYFEAQYQIDKIDRQTLPVSTRRDFQSTHVHTAIPSPVFNSSIAKLRVGSELRTDIPESVNVIIVVTS